MRKQQTESVRATQLCNNTYTKPVKEHNQRKAYANEKDKQREMETERMKDVVGQVFGKLTAFRAPFQKWWSFNVQTAGRAEAFPRAIHEETS